MRSYEYDYDDADRIASVDDIPCTWDDNGNLLNDGENDYTYDYANRLASVSDGETSASYAYNGLGDRLQQTVMKVFQEASPAYFFTSQLRKICRTLRFMSKSVSV